MSDHITPNGLLSLLFITSQDCIKVLLEYNADVNIKSSASQENMTPLGIAAAKGHYETVKFLHENGATPDLKSKDLTYFKKLAF